MNDITYLYKVYNKRGNLLYVGITERSVAQRIREHDRDKFWESKRTRVAVTSFKDWESAKVQESSIIRTEQPSYNRAEIPSTPSMSIGEGLIFSLVLRGTLDMISNEFFKILTRKRRNV